MNTKEIFMETYQKYIHRPGAASLLNWLLSTDFFEAPASTNIMAIMPVAWRSTH